MGKEKNAGGRKLVPTSAKGRAIVLRKSKRVAASQEPLIDLTAKYGQRIAELTEERERLVGEVKLSGEGLESLRSELRTVSEQRADVMERLGITSQDNAVLVKLNGELQVKISAGEVSAEEARRATGELKQANEALELLRVESRKQSGQQRDLTDRLDAVLEEKIALARRNEELRAKISGLEVRAKKADRLEAELAKTREPVKAEPVNETLPVNPVQSEEKPESVSAVPAEAHEGSSKISERVVPAVLAKWDVSDRSIVDKKNQKANMTLLERFMLPFRDTPHIS